MCHICIVCVYVHSIYLYVCVLVSLWVSLCHDDDNVVVSWPLSAILLRLLWVLLFLCIANCRLIKAPHNVGHCTAIWCCICHYEQQQQQQYNELLGLLIANSRLEQSQSLWGPSLHPNMSATVEQSQQYVAHYSMDR